MDDVIAQIKEYVLVIDSTITDDDFLDFMVENVVDRALVYMNRDQLVVQYEEDLEDYESDNDIWDCYDYPIPPRLERVLASTVVDAYKTQVNKKDATTGNIKSLSDGRQSISYTEAVASYMATAKDTELFSGTTEMMNKFRLVTVNDNTTRLQRRNK